MDLRELGCGELSDGRVRRRTALENGERREERRGVYEALEFWRRGHGGG